MLARLFSFVFVSLLCAVAHADLCESLKPRPEESGPVPALNLFVRQAAQCEVPDAEFQMDQMADEMTRKDNHIGWWIDRRPVIESEIVRAVWVYHCLAFGKSELEQHGESLSLPAYAVCGIDARRLDAAKLERELADARFDARAKKNIRQSFASAKKVADHWNKHYQDLAARDKEVRALVFDLPESMYRGWIKNYEENKIAWEAAFEIEEKFYGARRSAARGCSAPLRKHLLDYLRAKGVRTVVQIENAAREGVGGALLGALSYCDALDGNPTNAYVEYELAGNAPRGPRAAIFAALPSAVEFILSDRPRFVVQSVAASSAFDAPNDSLLPGARDLIADFVSVYAYGQIAALKPTRGGTQVTFRRKSAVEWQAHCHQTNRIARILPGGQVVYENKCHNTNRKSVIDTTEEPIVVPALYAAGLKVGQVAKFHTDKEEAPRQGIPLEVFSGADQKSLVVWLGLTL